MATTKRRGFTVPQKDIEALSDLIERLEGSDPLSEIEKRAKWDAEKELRSQRLFKMIESGKTLGAVDGSPAIYSLPQDEFLKTIRNTNDHLGWQVDMMGQFVDRWFDIADYPPPHYPWRITVILRKARLFETEHLFLRAYLRHFWTPRGSAANEKLVMRARKIGIDVPPVTLRSGR